MNTKSGIYCIENLINGKKYIGKAVNLKNRKRTHFRKLEGSCHFNAYLQNSYNKYGEENFHFFIIEYCEKERLSEKEKQYIHIFDTFKNGYNMTRGGEGSFGYRHSEESKEKMSRANKGKRHSKKTRVKMSKARSGENNPNYGKHLSEETKKKLSNATSGESWHGSKLLEKQVLEILDLYYKKGYTQKEISKSFPIGARTISGICHGKTWCKQYKSFMKANPNCFNFPNKKYFGAKLIKGEVLEILDLYYNKNKTQKDIAKKYDVSGATISLICLGKNWEDCYKEFMESHPNCLDFCNKKNYNAKLIEKQVLEILDSYYNKKEMQKDIAKKYDVNDRTISDICLGKNWKFCYKEFMETQGR